MCLTIKLNIHIALVIKINYVISFHKQSLKTISNTLSLEFCDNNLEKVHMQYIFSK